MVLRSENQGEEKLDWLKWAVALILLVIGLVGNYYYHHISMPIRTAGWVTLLVIAGFIASKTQKGKWVVRFVHDSRLELRKVIWPTRDEIMQTTLVVAVMVVILALILWGLDGTLVWLIGWLTGQHG